MSRSARPHLLGIDDGPVAIRGDGAALVVGVMMEGASLVEGVACTSFPVDGPDPAAFLARWVRGLRLRASLQGIVLGGITIAGLGVVDLDALARALGVPVIAVSRRDPSGHRLGAALTAAGVGDRLAIVERTPAAWRMPGGPYLACAGASRATAEALVRAGTAKARLPEPLRLAHMIARAIASGESRGRP